MFTFLKAKNKLVIRSIEIKKNQRMLHFDFKKGIQMKKKTLRQWRLTKVIEMKGIVVSVEVDEMYNYLEKCPSHCLS